MNLNLNKEIHSNLSKELYIGYIATTLSSALFPFLLQSIIRLTRVGTNYVFSFIKYWIFKRKKHLITNSIWRQKTTTVNHRLEKILSISTVKIEFETNRPFSQSIQKKSVGDQFLILRLWDLLNWKLDSNHQIIFIKSNFTIEAFHDNKPSVCREMPFYHFGKLFDSLPGLKPNLVEKLEVFRWMLKDFSAYFSLIRVLNQIFIKTKFSPWRNHYFLLFFGC